jgi:hypothetical protein
VSGSHGLLGILDDMKDRLLELWPIGLDWGDGLKIGDHADMLGLKAVMHETSIARRGLE